MFDIFGLPSTALFGQLLIGLINGSFYALLSLGLAVIFGMLNIINFSHGAQYMIGAVAAYLLLQWTELGYWPALILAPLVVGIIGVLLERNLISQLNSSTKERSIIVLLSSAVLFLMSVKFSIVDPATAFVVSVVAGFVVSEVSGFFRGNSSDANSPVDHLYGLLLTFGIALILEGVTRNKFGSAG